MFVTLEMCAPMLLASLTGGLLIAVFQAVTQISDSTLSFLPKLIGTGAAAWLTGPLMYHLIGDYTRMVMDRIIAIGGQ